MLSIFDIYKIGLGPSSSHTFGTMVASNMFVEFLKKNDLIQKTATIDIHLYGSLALTGYGHGTCLSIELGLEGFTPDGITPDKVQTEKARIAKEHILYLQDKNGDKKKIKYDKHTNRFFHYDALQYHPNGLKFVAKDAQNDEVYSNTYFSIGGGFVLTLDEMENGEHQVTKKDVKYNFSSFKELLEIARKNNKTIYDIVLENELQWQSLAEIDDKIKKIVFVMNETINNGITRTDDIRGALKLKRRAPELMKKATEKEEKLKLSRNDNVDENGNFNDKIAENLFLAMDFVSAWAFATSEENASFDRLVTAPTNGASGVIPAVIKFTEKYLPKYYNAENLRKFMIVSGIIGIFCKMNASISGAECGCQAEIGTACAMASAGLAALQGGTDEQIENASIIGLVHNFGLTCDPVGGYVQVPCIERNAINAIKAIYASRIALQEEKSGFLTLDVAIKTMKETGQDINCKYRETSLGGLAKNCKCFFTEKKAKC